MLSIQIDTKTTAQGPTVYGRQFNNIKLSFFASHMLKQTLYGY